MARKELMPQKSFGLLKSIAKERSKKKGNRGVAKSDASLPSGIGLLDYVDMPPVDAVTTVKNKKLKSPHRVCHPVVIVGLVTVIVYIIFMTFLIGYFHVPKIKVALDSLKRLANIKEWLRIIFKPWYNNDAKDKGGGGDRFNDEDNGDDDEKENPPIGPRLNPELDVHLYPMNISFP